MGQIWFGLEIETETYMEETLDGVVLEVEAVTEPLGWTVVAEQSDNEAELIGLLFKHPGIRAAIINPGALMIAGWSFRDALEDVAFP
jgi:5-deoxy-5-amino-3-dehydroquinate dehydratase